MFKGKNGDGSSEDAQACSQGDLMVSAFSLGMGGDRDPISILGAQGPAWAGAGQHSYGPSVCLNSSSLHWQYVSEQLQAHKQLVVSTCSVADIQAAFNTTVSRIQR